jgi:cell wall-associated NlpC family hydrolase
MVGLPALAQTTPQTTAAQTTSSVVPVAAAQALPGTAAGATGTQYSDQISDLADAAADALQARSLGVVPAQIMTTQSQLASPIAVQATSTGFSSTVIDTEDLGAFFAGTPISRQADPSVVASLAAVAGTEPSVRYAATIRQLANVVGNRNKISPAALELAWSRTDDRRMRAVLTALAQVGTMYRYTGNKPGGFDCSGLTSYAWSQAGVKIPRVSTDQIMAAAPRAAEQLLPGDLVWRPGHIAMYLGVEDLVVHSPQTGKPVETKRWGKVQRFGSPI